MERFIAGLPQRDDICVTHWTPSSIKTFPLTFDHSFWQMNNSFKIVSFRDSCGSCPRICVEGVHLTFTMLLHYLVKFANVVIKNQR